MLVTVLLVTNLMNICAIAADHAGLRAGVGRGRVRGDRRRFACRSGSFASSCCRSRFSAGFHTGRWPRSRMCCGLRTSCSRRCCARAACILRLAPRKPEERKLFAAREDFKYLTIESERQGTLLPVEREMIHNVMDLGSAKARDVMVPIARVRSLPASATVPELLDLARGDRPRAISACGQAGEFRGAGECVRGADGGGAQAAGLGLPAADCDRDAGGGGLQHHEEDAGGPGDAGGGDGRGKDRWDWWDSRTLRGCW